VSIQLIEVKKVVDLELNFLFFLLRADESARAASLYEAVKTYVGDGNVRNHRWDSSEQKKRESISPSENKMLESSSLSDQKMRESFSQSDQKIKETNGNTEDENIDNGNVSTDRTETGSPSDEVNI
jgi:hypothetical protein